ncbi:hypothetical protein E1B28_010936 [Marasmius oreades]|uniref:C2H2-type domain-containing protein n=1 Tax=Marasmius oreades TaxID=181124 RepID=A0A9P7UP05_9AGAR|nr:uncharacterized protein E1B28_010936 [Marasmius oreades]KAG7089237.1 hypothetical protein E1B28_010936 [Marasmius oreades]
MNHDMETPSIVVEPPSEEVDLIDGGHTPSLTSALQSFYGMYQDTTSSSGNTSTEQGLFSTPLDLSPGQISPLITTGLRDAQSGNMFLSASGQNSPIEASSPASTSSGDPVFPENWSDCSSQWSPSHDSSSHPSSPSMSPINTSMLNFTFNDPPYLEETFQEAPAANRMRSNSYSGGSGSESSPEASNSGRPRSASFTNVNDHYFHVESQWDPSFQATGFVASPLPNDFPAVDTNIYSGNVPPGFGSPTSPSYSPVNDGWNVPDPSSGPLPTFMNYHYPSLSGPPPNPNSNPNPMMTSHSRSQSTHLTVPSNTSLQRRGAHRRSHSHTGVHEHTSPPISPTLSDPATRGLSPSTRGRQSSPSFTPNHSRPSSAASFNYETYFQQVDQSAAFLNINPATQIPSNMSDSSSSFLSPSPGPSSASQSPVQSPVAPPIELAVPDFTGTKPLPAIKVDDSLIRRHSYAGGPHVHADRSPETLHRATSDPLGRGRKIRTRSRFQGLLRPQKEVDESSQFRDFSSMMIDVPVEGIASTSAATSPLSSDSEHKDIVASNKIVDASYKRRKKPDEKARFVCPICRHTFTAKHNLNNHINSHNGVKPFRCDVCKQTFTTSGTAKRHQNNCTGKMPRKRP